MSSAPLLHSQTTLKLSNGIFAPFLWSNGDYLFNRMAMYSYLQ
jgi:hypothetical protein